MQLKTIELPIDQIQEFCERWQIIEFALFGFVLCSQAQASSIEATTCP
jgi:hypothetical protein